MILTQKIFSFHAKFTFFRPLVKTAIALLFGVSAAVMLTSCTRPIGNYDPWKVPGTLYSPTQIRVPSQTIDMPGASPSILTVSPTAIASPQATITLASAGPTPTPDAPVSLPPLRTEALIYIVQQGDNLGRIALSHQVSVKQILAMNNIPDPNLIEPGQTLTIPPSSANELATNFKIIPDAELYYGPSAAGFDTSAIVAQYHGKLAVLTEEQEDGSVLSGSEVVQKVADDFSINPRLLLAVLEYRSGWLTGPGLEGVSEDYPLGLRDITRSGLYDQLAWAANEMTRGFTLWQQQALAVWTLADDSVLRIDPTINAGTAGVQYLFSLLLAETDWKQAVSAEGLYATYSRLFGFPFAFSVEPLVPQGLNQPDFELPLAPGDIWSLTGGPHWGWGTGSPWAALDFAPPGGEEDYGCFESMAPVVAVADGDVVRSGYGAVVLDLDGDGSEQTGWTVLYMHIGSNGRVARGTKLKAGDLIGYASCEGGVTTGTHFHLARRYNGVWIDAGGQIPFNLGGWVASSLGTVYDGYLIKDGQTVEAYDGRADFNQISR